MRLLSSLGAVRSASTTTTATAAAAARPPRDSQILTLPDGRRLGYAEYGPATGTPLLYFHGFPSARLEAVALESLARRRNVRVLSLDRPGFGLSTPLPGRRLLDWPADVRAFAETMGIERFAVLGCSGGGPFALACARELPPGMMSAVGVLAGGPPWVGPSVNDYLRYYRVGRFMALWMPGVTRVVSGAVVGVARWVVSTRVVARWIDGVLSKVREARKEKEVKAGEEDKSLLEAEEGEETQRTVAESRELVLRGLFEPFAQGAGPMVQEARILTGDWGFRFSDVSYDNILLWHGSEDRNAPIRMVRWLAEQLPHARLREFEKTTHFNIHEHLEEVFEDLLEEIGRKEALLQKS